MRLVLILTISFCCFTANSLSAQTLESGDIVTKVNGIISGLPGEDTDVYVPPGMSESSDWETMLGNLFAGNYATADTEADALGYDLVEFTDNTNAETYYVLEKTNASTNYWGTYVYNPNACRNELVIQAPHPRKDFNTGKQGIYIFKTIDALFYMLSGTNRCNSMTTSSCDGMTTVCNDMDISEDYPISDLAHVTDAIWQTTTAYIHDNIGGTYFAQLHGFGKGDNDPYVIMSNGTRDTPTPDYLSDLSTELFAVDNTLTFKIGHIDLMWDRLLGFTNTQGRYINSSTDACEDNATMTNGRFMHLEQEKSKLRDDSTGWHKMAMALGATFSEMECGAVAALLPVEWFHFSAEAKEEKVLLMWTTTLEKNNAHFEIERTNTESTFVQIGRVESQGDSQLPQNYSFEDVPPPGKWNYRLKQVDWDGQFSYSPIRNVEIKNDRLQVWLAGNELKINTSDPSPIRIYDTIGRLIWQGQIQESLDLSQFSKGMFVYFIGDDASYQCGKLLLK